MNPTISVVIPTYKRWGILKLHLEYLEAQTLKDFEVIVVNDDIDSELIPIDADDYSYRITILENRGKGPAKARNYGAELAESEIVLFVGDDCLPDNQLLWRHYYNHSRTVHPIAVQGFSPFHPRVMDTEFMHFLNSSGMQANWTALRDGENWKDKANGFLLTTNWSVNKRLFMSYNGFNESFPNAAWEDVELGVRMKDEITVFDHRAVNFHWHKYDLQDFSKRQFMEGRSRLTMISLQPESSVDLIPPDDLRFAAEESLEQWYKIARSVSDVHHAVPDSRQRKYETWQQVLRLSSLKGALSRIEELGGAYSFLPYFTNKETMVMILNGVSHASSGNKGYALHCIQWANDKGRDSWAVQGSIAEIYYLLNMEREGTKHLENAVATAPDHGWLQERLKEKLG